VLKVGTFSETQYTIEKEGDDKMLIYSMQHCKGTPHCKQRIVTHKQIYNTLYNRVSIRQCSRWRAYTWQVLWWRWHTWDVLRCGICS